MNTGLTHRREGIFMSLSSCHVSIENCRFCIRKVYSDTHFISLVLSLEETLSCVTPSISYVSNASTSSRWKWCFGTIYFRDDDDIMTLSGDDWVATSSSASSS